MYGASWPLRVLNLYRPRRGFRFCAIFLNFAEMLNKNYQFGCAQGRGRPAGREAGPAPARTGHPNLAFVFFCLSRKLKERKIVFDQCYPHQNYAGSTNLASEWPFHSVSEDWFDFVCVKLVII